jgi:hypothetical protein
VHGEYLIAHAQINRHMKMGFTYVHKIDHGTPKHDPAAPPKYFLWCSHFLPGTGEYPRNEKFWFAADVRVEKKCKSAIRIPVSGRGPHGGDTQIGSNPARWPVI